MSPAHQRVAGRPFRLHPNRPALGPRAALWLGSLAGAAALPLADPLPPLAPGQTRNTNAPPQVAPVPGIDGGVPPVTPRRLIPGDGVFDRQRFINTNSPARSAAEFNPDPGGKIPTAPPVDPFFRQEPAPAPPYQGEPVPPERFGPRGPLRDSTLVPRPPKWPSDGTYGREPLPPGQTLPRENVRQNEKLEFEAHENPEYPLTERGEGIPPGFVPKPDRYRSGFGFTPWRRYTSGEAELPYQHLQPALWHPYRQSLLKGDLPVWGQDTFLNLTGTSDTSTEFRRIPVPSGISAKNPDTAEFFGNGDQITIQQYFGVAVELFSGEAAFKPPHWSVKLVPVFNVNNQRVAETSLLSPDPRGPNWYDNTPPPPNGGVYHPGDVGNLLNGQLGYLDGSQPDSPYSRRTRLFAALQEYTVEYHIADLTDNYDFVAVKGGNQVFDLDFRGFVFNDTNLGGRVFGNYGANRWQYNVAGFSMREKDTFSGLNTFNRRDQQVFAANVYRQDLLTHGYTGQFSVAASLDDSGIQYDRIGSIVRPAPVGTVIPHSLDAYYLGWAGEGHLGPVNISHQIYQALGTDSFNPIAGRPVDINARLYALELSLDRDWLRYRAAFFHTSGDDDPSDGVGEGFDTILDNANFVGGPFSYYVRQGVPLGGTAVGLKQAFSLVPSLRTSKIQGQQNFVNPGIFIYNLGLDADVTPKLRSFFNANYLRFAQVASLETVLMQPGLASDIGFDLSLGVQWRPWLTDNVIVTAGFAVLLPGEGYKDIFRRSTDPVPGFDEPGPEPPGWTPGFLYSAVIALNLTF